MENDDLPEQRSRVLEVIDEVMLNERAMEKYLPSTRSGRWSTSTLVCLTVFAITGRTRVFVKA